MIVICNDFEETRSNLLVTYSITYILFILYKLPIEVFAIILLYFCPQYCIVPFFFSLFCLLLLLILVTRFFTCPSVLLCLNFNIFKYAMSAIVTIYWMFPEYWSWVCFCHGWWIFIACVNIVFNIRLFSHVYCMYVFIINQMR